MNHGYEVFGPDVAAIADFYVDVLGFVMSDEADAGELDYVTVQRDQLRVGCSRHLAAPLMPRKPPTGSEIVLRVDDVHAEHQRVETAGWPVEDPLQERPWGLVDFRVFDPTGQYIRITDAGPRSAR